MRRMLLVDDEEDILLSIALILEGHYEIVVARNGAEALDLVQALRFDVILLDLQMPILDGAGFMASYRGCSDAAPVVLLSAGMQLEERARELEASDWIAKPFELDELSSKLDCVIRAAQRRGRAPETSDSRADETRERNGGAARSVHLSFPGWRATNR